MKLEFLPVLERSTLMEVERLGAEIWQDHYTPIIGTDQVEYMLDKYQSLESMWKQIQNGAFYFLIRTEDENLGYLCLIPELNHLFISKFYVLKAHRGKGIGSKSIDFFEGFAESHDLRRLRLTVNKHNDKSIAFYKKVGFKKIDAVKTDIGKGYFMDDYIMEKSFSKY